MSEQTEAENTIKTLEADLATAKELQTNAEHALTSLKQEYEAALIAQASKYENEHAEKLRQLELSHAKELLVLKEKISAQSQ